MTHQIIPYFVAGILSYLLGAIPTGYVIARMKGIDIRQVGSGNTGATNVFRTIGRGWGILTLALDMLKGFVPAFFLPVLADRILADVSTPGLGVLCACAAVIGHNWPVYLAFKGGKGVATSLGGILGIAPLAVICGLAAWIIAVAATRYVSVGSIAGAIVVAAASWRFYRDAGIYVPTVLTALAGLIIWRHKANIKRLMTGTEHRFVFRGKENS